MKNAKATGLALGLLMLGTPAQAATGKFTVKSAQLPTQGLMATEQVFNSFGCTGENVSPAIEWSGAPEGTQSFAVTMYDPDAPTGSGWWHWTIYNIPASYKGLPKGFGKFKETELADGIVQGRTDFGESGYGGPCPPAGDKPHRYIVTVYALKVSKLDVPASAPAAQVGFNTHFNALASAKLTAQFGRK